MIAVFGGTFDPVHYGHLRPLLSVQQALALDEIRLLPCLVPPHREPPLATSQQRLEMLQQAVAEEGSRHLVIDERELRRSGPSYMVDTLQSLRQEVGSEPLVLVLGMDAFKGLMDWHHWQQILQLAHLVVTWRPGSLLPTTGALAEVVVMHMAQEVTDLRGQPAGLIWFQEVDEVDLSATQVREAVRRGESLQPFVPDAVAEYISAQGLYR